MNGVAREYWNEVFDLHAPVSGEERPARLAARRKLVRRIRSRPRPEKDQRGSRAT